MAADRTHRTWAEIDLDAIAHNLREIRRHTDTARRRSREKPWRTERPGWR